MTKQKCSTLKTAFGIIGFLLLNMMSFQANASITSISVSNGKFYQASILKVGAIQYIDRNFTFTNIDDLGNREFIQTANNDKSSTASNFLTFTITQPGLVCVAHDDRITRKPSWLSQFTLTNKDIVTTDGQPFSIYTKHFDAGTIVLGGNIAVSSGSNISMYSVVVVEEVRPTISDIEVSNGRTYRISMVALGEEQYIDRDYVFTQIGSLGGRQFIQAFNNDKFTVSDSFLSFTLDMPAVIYVAHDDRIATKPDWLLSFTDIGINILNSDNHNPMSVFQKIFPAGRVTLGGNVQTTPPNKFISMYTVIVGDAVEFITFSRTYNGIGGFAVQQTSDGGYIIGGATVEGNPVGYPEVYIIRTNTVGDTIWTKIYTGPPNICTTKDLQKTSDGGYIITAMFNNDVLLLKIDSSGNEIWRKTFIGETSDIPFSVQETFDGGYVIGGLRNVGTGIADIFMIRTDENGNQLWKKTFGNSGADIFCSSLQANDSGFIIVTTTREGQNLAYLDIYIAKTDKNGNLEWIKTFGNEMTDELPGSIRKTKDGGYILSYTTWNNAFSLLKIDVNGNKSWQKNLAYNYALNLSTVIQTSDGGYIALRGSNADIFKTDPNGNTIWNKSYSVETLGYANTIQQTTDGGYVITGTTGNNTYLLKTDVNGNIDQ
jgi:hypothetical protein